MSCKNTITLNGGVSKNLWCRDELAQHMIKELGRNPFKENKGSIIKKCKYTSGECRGAHCISEIKVLPTNNIFANSDKTKIEWVGIYNSLYKSLINDLPKIKNPEHIKQINNINIKDANFIQVIQLWRELACYYRKLQKELFNKNDSLNNCDFKNPEDVPIFSIPEKYEDTVWSFERKTRFCSIYQNLTAKIRTKIPFTLWDLCVATGDNCKEGIHELNEMICYDDFLHGKCDCKTLFESEQQESEYLKQIIELTNYNDNIQLNDDEGWSTIKSKKAKKYGDERIEIKNKITILENKINELKKSRKIHYTEKGFIPFTKQYNDYLIRKQELEKINNEKPIKQEIWEQKTEPVKKLIKPGQKIKQ
jgi:hypothetical protein